ncbi:MAG: hypothetical protein ACOC6L_02025 [Thermodesulfobacteriota bacterium]
MAAKTGGVDGPVQPGQRPGVVFDLFPSRNHQGRLGQLTVAVIGSAIGFQVAEEPGMVLIQSAVHHRQKLFGRVRAAFADDVLEQRIVAGEEDPG